MAILQEATYHEDKVAKKPITHLDLCFLRALQTELNTQDTMGNADPRFWVIKETKKVPTDIDHSDETILTDDEGSDIAENIVEAMEWLKEWMDENMPKYTLTYSVKGNRPGHIEAVIMKPDGKTNLAKEILYGIEDAKNFLENITHEDFQLHDVLHIDHTVPDTLFLTHKGCQDYLKQYGYNHKPDAHAYTMTAVRSPEYERLLKIIQETDFDLLEAMLVNSQMASKKEG